MNVALWYWAPLAAVAYFLLSLLIGDRFPFSAYKMYASTAQRTEGAVIVCFADGALASVDDYERFAGIDPAAIYPRGLACSLEWQVNEHRRWIERHVAPTGAPDGPVRIDIGYRLLAVDAAGRVSERIRVVARGTAWPKVA
jgi:hypothetical protein